MKQVSQQIVHGQKNHDIAKHVVLSTSTSFFRPTTTQLHTEVCCPVCRTSFRCTRVGARGSLRGVRKNSGVKCEELCRKRGGPRSKRKELAPMFFLLCGRRKVMKKESHLKALSRSKPLPFCPLTNWEGAFLCKWICEKLQDDPSQKPLKLKKAYCTTSALILVLMLEELIRPI